MFIRTSAKVSFSSVVACQVVREILEIFVLLFLTLLRVWVPVFHYNRVAGGLWIAMALGFVVYAQYRRWNLIRSCPGAESSLAYEAGIRWDTFFPCLRLLLPWVLLFLLLIAGIVLALIPPALCDHPFRSYVLYFFWALVQQYLLQGVIVVRLRALNMGRGATAFLAGCLFGCVHLPNPTLTVTSFLGGWILSHAFLTYPNLFCVALAHSLVASTMKCFLPPTLLPNMYVGIFYLYPPP